jgi:esterase
MPPVLSHSRVVAAGAAPGRWLYLLHGIYGSGRNWASLARRLVDASPFWGAILVDLRLHGGSTGFEPPHSLRACADDVARLEAHLGLPAAAMLGHSFGGKVTLLRAAEAAGRLAHAWVADSTLRTGEPSGAAWRLIEVVRSLPATFASRDDLARAVTARGYPRRVGQWLAMNLERSPAGLRWKLDWDGIEEMLRDYFATDIWPVVENPPAGTHLHFIRASESDAIGEDSVGRLRAAGERTGRVHLHTVRAGHWLNLDNPDAVLELLLSELG